MSEVLAIRKRRAAAQYLETLRAGGHGALAARILKEVGKVDNINALAPGRGAAVVAECQAHIRELRLVDRVVKRAKTALQTTLSAATDRAQSIVADAETAIESAAADAAELATRQANLRRRREAADTARRQQAEIDKIKAFDARPGDHGLTVTADGKPFNVPWCALICARQQHGRTAPKFIATDAPPLPGLIAFKHGDVSGFADLRDDGLNVRVDGRAVLLPWPLVHEARSLAPTFHFSFENDGRVRQYAEPYMNTTQTPIGEAIAS
jgi:hypothetical protein